MEFGLWISLIIAAFAVAVVAQRFRLSNISIEEFKEPLHLVESERTSEVAIALPNEDFKGRLIGRDGKNFEAFESATQAKLIIDNRADFVFLRCKDFDQRGIATLAIQNIISDGRIHPQMIVETVEKVKANWGSNLLVWIEEELEKLGQLEVTNENKKWLCEQRSRQVGNMNGIEFVLEVGRRAQLFGLESADVETCMIHAFHRDLSQLGAIVRDALNESRRAIWTQCGFSESY